MEADEIKSRLQLLIREAQSLYEAIESSGPAVFPEESAQKVRNHICLECGKPITATQRRKAKRGVHEACYQQQRRAIAERKYTEADLVANGKLAPPRKPGRPRNKTSLELEEGEQ